MLRARDAMDRAYAQPLDVPVLAQIAHERALLQQAGMHRQGLLADRGVGSPPAGTAQLLRERPRSAHTQSDLASVEISPILATVATRGQEQHQHQRQNNRPSGAHRAARTLMRP
jgi:hypothetical protein